MLTGKITSYKPIMTEKKIDLIGILSWGNDRTSSLFKVNLVSGASPTVILRAFSECLRGGIDQARALE